MNKFYVASLAALGLMFGACSEQLDAPVPGADGMVTITAKLPSDIASRAFAQGTNATTLSYAVYEAGTQNIIFSSEEAGSPQAEYAGDLAFTLSLNLVKGQTYDFIFWADAEGAPYTFVAADQKVTIDYEGIVGNDDDRDAFFNAEKGLLVTGAMKKSIQLRRPFAQLNIGTDDIDVAAAAKVNHKYTTVTVKNAYSELNLFSGIASGAMDVTFPAHEVNAEAFPVAHANADMEYAYLSMNYVLTGSIIPDANINEAQKETKDVVIALADEAGARINEFKLSAVPFQRNYRTNIYGSLLTSQVDFTIDIVPGFFEPDHVYGVTTPAEFLDLFADASATEISIAAGAELDLSEATAEQLTNDMPKTITMGEGASIVLANGQAFTANADLTIEGGEITNAEAGDAGFGSHKSLIHANAGTLTLKNTTLVNDPAYHQHDNVVPGFNSAAIAYWNDAEVVIDGCSITSGEFVICGMGKGANSGTVTLTNSYFESTSSVANNGRYWAYGMRIYGSKCTISNCEVKGIQGAVSADGGVDMTIDGGKYYTVNTPGKTDGFYAVYVTGGSKVTILDGEFYGANVHSTLGEGKSCVVCGDNDTNQPLGSVVIKGGKFSAKAFNHVTGTVYQPDEWVALTDQDPYKWTVAE